MDNFSEVVCQFKFESLNHRLEKENFPQKNSSLSSHFRTEGNKLYIQKNHNENIHLSTLILYTKSIALAIENSEEQALAYGNRSALLMHLGKYKKCLIDVNRACKITKSAELKKKLLLRKKKCLVLINDEYEKVKTLNGSKKLLDSCPQDISFFVNFMKNHGILHKELQDGLSLSKEKVYKDIQEFEKPKVPKILFPNQKIPNFLDCLSLEYNEKYGRHVVATRDIKPGEILVVEKSLVFPAIDKIYLACSHCLNFTWNGTPCSSCIFAIYCSEKCKTKAWQEYHDIECCILPPLFSEAFSSQDYSREMFSLRLLIKFAKNEGLQNIIDEAKSIKEDKNSHINAFLTEGKFDNTKFRAFYNLMNHKEEVNKKENDNLGSVGVLLLTKYTTFLDVYKAATYLEDNKNFDSTDFKNIENLVQLKHLIVKLKTTIDNNHCLFQDPTCECEDVFLECVLNCPKNLGVVVAPCSSLFNHSCFPNTAKVFCKDSMVVTISIRPVKKNEQLFGSIVFLTQPKKERQAILREFYHFTCDCEACKDKWLENPKKDKELDLKKQMRIAGELVKYSMKVQKTKELDYLSLAVSIKHIELGFKNFNNYDAFRFAEDKIMYLLKIIPKLYGIEVKIPKNC